MTKDRTLITFCLSISFFLLVSSFRPTPTTVTVLPLWYDAVQNGNPVSERFWVMKAQAATHFDMILMGDSRVYRGLSPKAMASILQGYRILNYGFSGGGLNPVMYHAAELRLDPASQQKCILLGVAPLTLTPRAERNEHFLQEMGRTPDYVFLHLYWTPFLKLTEPIHLNTLSNHYSENTAQTQEGYYLEFHDDGWVASWTVPEYTNAALPSYREIFASTQVSSQLVQVLMEQTRQWLAQGIKVYAFRPPSSQAMVALENQVSSFNEAIFIQQFEAAGGTWLSVPLAPYHSYDGSHLVKESAVQLSLDLARMISLSAAPPTRTLKPAPVGGGEEVNDNQ